MICDDPALVGQPLAPVTEDDCGIAAPVRVTQASGIALDPPARLDCTAARPLAVWLRRGPQASFARRGAHVEAVVVADSYSCRNRNRVATAKRSEHAYGRAIDIAAFRLRDGRTVTVREGWTAADWGTGPAPDPRRRLRPLRHRARAGGRRDARGPPAFRRRQPQARGLLPVGPETKGTARRRSLLRTSPLTSYRSAEPIAGANCAIRLRRAANCWPSPGCRKVFTKASRTVPVLTS